MINLGKSRPINIEGNSRLGMDICNNCTFLKELAIIASENADFNPICCISGLTKPLNLQRLKLHMAACVFKKNTMNLLASTFDQIPNLQEIELMLSSSGLTDECLEIISKGLSKLRKLNGLKLDLSYNKNLSDKGVKTLADSLKFLICLKKIIFFLDHIVLISDEGVGQLITELSQINALYELELKLGSAEGITRKSSNT